MSGAVNAWRALAARVRWSLDRRRRWRAEMRIAENPRCALEDRLSALRKAKAILREEPRL